MKSGFENLNKDISGTHENEYRGDGKLFASKDEFDSFYIKGKDIYQAEVEKRKILKYFSDNAKSIESMDFQKEKKRSVGSVLGITALTLATGGAGAILFAVPHHTNENEIRKNILATISENKDKSYYSQILDFVIETNKGLNTEWSKNGEFFENKAEFYNAYLSDDYKKILKTNKKNFKSK